MIYTLTMNPALDKTAELEKIQIGGLNRLQNVISDAGGKGINVSKTLRFLEKESVCLGVIAGNTGKYIQNELDELSIKHDFFKINGNTRTNLKIVDGNTVLSEFNEAGPSPDKNKQEEIINHILSLLNKNDILVVSGSVPSEVDKDFYYRIIKNVKSKGIRVILDADGPIFKEGVKAIPNIIKPNRYELSQYFHVSEDISDLELIDLSRKWIEQGIELVVVSMGSDGAYFITKEDVIKAEALKVKSHSSVGAGDAMVAALAYSMEDNLLLEETARLCSACGAGAVMSKGTKPASKQLVKKLKKDVILQKK